MEVALTKSLVEQFVYEIEHYGTILNANRTYFLTIATTHFDSNDFGSSSTPKICHGCNLYLPSIESYYYYWTVPPHLNQTGLSRYFDLGEDQPQKY